ncbi:MAG: DNA repair exonuclease SbcCD ATPase subunit [Planctomycetota bacterium]|jgi:DNA repair exonuclease SbcCD ATPase subunit
MPFYRGWQRGRAPDLPVRILHLDLQQFGALHGRRFSTDSPAVVVCGRNERGKSSFHQALRSALFGFSPPTAKLHPFASAAFLDSGAESEWVLEISATIQSSAGKITVERRMDSAASMRLTLGGDAARDADFVRSNAALPTTGTVTASLFDAVYTLDPDGASAFDRHLNGEIEELLLGGSALPGLPSIAQLDAELDAERTSLWRNDRRSKKTVASIIDARLAELQAEGRETRRIEDGLVQLESDLAAGRRTLQEELAQLASLDQRLAALRWIERAARITRSVAEHDVDLSPFDRVPLASPAPMLADLEDAELALEDPNRRLAEPELGLRDDDRALLAHAESIEGLARDEARVTQAASKADALRARAQELTSSAQHLERSLLRPREDGSRTSPLDDDLVALRALAADWRRAFEPEADSATGGGPTEATQAALSPAAWGISLAAGVIAGGAAASTGSHWAGALLSTLAPPAALWAVQAIGRSRAAPAHSAASPDAPRGLAELVQRTGLAPALASNPDELASAVEPLTRAATLREEADDCRLSAAKLDTLCADARARWSQMARDLVPDSPAAEWSSSEDAPALLRARLQRAEEGERAYRTDAEQRKAALAELERAAAKLRDMADRFEVLRKALEQAVPNESVLERAHQRAAEAWTARERSIGALRELREDPAWEVAEAEPSIGRALGDGTFDAGELRGSEDDADRLMTRITERREELARMDERLQRERPARTRSAIDSEAAELRTQRADAMAQHAQLTRLREALLEGERRHRASHQPAILQSASRWLESITDGRYRALAFDGTEGSGLTVFSREADAHVPCEPPLSRGVREQVHLALRLGVAEAADAGGDPLPLLLDEALVHWDEDRRAGLFRALKARAGLPGARQVFLFTCHGNLAEEAEAQLEALRIDL